MLAVDNLSVSIGRHRIVKDVSFRAAPGALTALVGPNGSGKSTLLRGVAGLAEGQGAISVDRHRMSDTDRRRSIAYMPQDVGPSSSLSLVEVVLLGRLGSLGLSVPGRMVDEAVDALDQFGLAALQDRTLDAVSGGQRQLAYLAQALFRRPKVLLLDEPTAALDLRHQLEVLEAVREHAAVLGTVVVTAIHDLTLAARFAKHVVCLSDGEVIAHGPPTDTFNKALLSRVYGVDVGILGEGDLLSIVPIRVSR